MWGDLARLVGEAVLWTGRSGNRGGAEAGVETVGGNLNTELWNWGVKGEAGGRNGEAGSRMGVKCGEKESWGEE